MKIQRQITDRVRRRFHFLIKAAVFVTAASYLKHKSVTDIMNFSFGAADADTPEFETDLAHQGLFLLAQAAGDDCQADVIPTSKADEWKEYPECTRIESSNGFIEEYWEEQVCHR